MRADAALAVEQGFAEAALRPEKWPNVLEFLGESVGARGALIQMVGPGEHRMLSSRRIAGTLDAFVSGNWHVANSRMVRGLALSRAGHRGFVTEYHMFTPDELRRDVYQNEFAIRHGVDSEAGIILAESTGTALVLTMPRGQDAGPYDAGELADLNRLAGRLASLCDLALRLKTVHAAQMVDAFEQRGEAMALLADGGLVLFHTAGFAGLLGDGLGLGGGRVGVCDHQVQNALDALILRTGRWPDVTEPLEPVVVPRRGRMPLVMRCHPVAGAARDFLGLAKVVLTVDDLGRRLPLPPSELLVGAFGLTPAEARLAVRLADGEPLREAADAEAIAYETARSRLKAIFQKIGVDRQSRLAVLVARLGGTGP